MHCPITYENISDDARYSRRGLNMLSPQLKDIAPLPLSASEQRQEAIKRSGKMSIQGVQTKLSAQLKVKKQCFEIVDKNGHYILKTPHASYQELPENEAISMTLAKEIGLEVPVHGLLYAKDKSMTYFIKRFDRRGQNQKIAVEDFAQLLGLDRETKYDSTMEQVVSVIQQYCSFPKIELLKLFKLTLFNFLIGNEDMHLKNFSLITRNNITMLSPVYDLLNTSIAIGQPQEEIALAINGNKINLNRKTLIEYFAKQRMELNDKVIEEVLQQIQSKLPAWRNLIRQSFMSTDMQDNYLALIDHRCHNLGIQSTFL